MSQHDLSVEAALGDRQVLPRWRSPVESTEELVGTQKASAIDPAVSAKWSVRLRRALHDNPSSFVATELRETAFVLGLPLSQEEEATINRLALRRERPNFASVILSRDFPLLDSRTTIKQLRGKIYASPRQPLAWAELSRQYLSTGHPERAEKAMRCALSVAPSNKYVLRSAVRLYSHIGEHDKALALLRRNARTVHDPWLLSAEIATSSLAHGGSRLIGVAQRMLDDKRSAPRQYAELAAALGTIEHHNGRHKKAKKLFAQSLVDPTENALAQALWVSQRDDKILVSQAALSTPDSYEAQARAAYADGDWRRAHEQSYQWLIDEPFDPKAAILGSVISFVNELAPSAVEIATLGLQSAKDTPILLNNRAVAYAYSGKITEAFLDVRHAVRLVRDDAHILATLGLIGYRAGWLEFGARAYSQAVAWFAGQKDAGSALRASLYWLREEMRLGLTDGQAELAAIKDGVNRLPLRDRESDLLGLIKIIEAQQSGGSVATDCPMVELDLEDLAARLDVPDAARASAEQGGGSKLGSITRSSLRRAL